MPPILMKVAGFFLLVFLSLSAHASFGGTPCRADFGCHFVMWGVFLAVVVGIPVSSAIFCFLHFWFRNPARSKVNQAFIGAVVGVVAYEFAAVAASLVASFGQDARLGLVPVWLLFAAASVSYARRSPSEPASGEDS